jgi:hypothetical protein
VKPFFAAPLIESKMKETTKDWIAVTVAIGVLVALWAAMIVFS